VFFWFIEYIEISLVINVLKQIFVHAVPSLTALSLAVILYTILVLDNNLVSYDIYRSRISY